MMMRNYLRQSERGLINVDNYHPNRRRGLSSSFLRHSEEID
jgi:hypothetical protein